MTAFTFTVTLSRVITSCAGTSRVSTRNETRTMRSMGAKTRMMPGPLGLGSTRPRRKITPRSYSARILMEDSRYTPTMMRMTSVETSNGISLASRLFFYRLDGQLEMIDGGNTNALTRRHGPRRNSVPILSTYKYVALRLEI